MADEIFDTMRKVLGRRYVHETARVLKHWALQRDFSSLNGNELDDIERACSAIVSAIKMEHLNREGWVVKEWDRNGPGAEFSHRTYVGQGPGPFDHLKKLVNKKEEKVIYLSEPYGVILNPEMLSVIGGFILKGWDITINPHWSTHFPGRTTGVLFSKEKK